MERDANSAADEVDLVLFEWRGRRVGADVSEVASVVRAQDAGNRRALRVRAASGGEAELPIDKLVGFRRVPVQSLRALPRYAEGIVEPGLVGFVLEDDGLLPLMNLCHLVSEKPRGATGAAAPADAR